jgi:hypothetical protein
VPSGFATLGILAVALGGCDRGCLSTWLAEHGAAIGAPGSGGRDAAATTLDLGGTDCSDGLARCSAGQVEVSIAGHVPHPCTAPQERPGACACPWQHAGSCAAGCVKDGLEVVAAPEIAREQLCASTAMVLRPATVAESAAVTICADDSVSCIDGMVRVCPAPGQPARLAGACANGCATGISLDQGDVVAGDGAAAILCRRAHAERQ